MLFVHILCQSSSKNLHQAVRLPAGTFDAAPMAGSATNSMFLTFRRAIGSCAESCGITARQQPWRLCGGTPSGPHGNFERRRLPTSGVSGVGAEMNGM